MKELKLNQRAFLRVLDIEEDINLVKKYFVVNKTQNSDIKDNDIVIIRSEKLLFHSHYIYIVHEYADYFVLEDYYPRGY